MKCHICGNEMKERRVRFCACEAEPPLIIENVPALVCDACGEQVFTSATVAFFERVKAGKVRQTRTDMLRVYDFAMAVNSLSAAE